MYDRFKGKARRIILGVALEGDESNLLSAAVTLAQRTGMTLRLVHVTEPWRGRHLAATYPGEYISSQISHMADEKHMRDAERRLQEVAQEFQGKALLETQVIYGYAAEGLRAEATAQRASLIMCGTRHGKERLMPQGLSTAMDLMAHATVPVLVIPAGAGVKFAHPEWTILVADDLHDTSRDALGVAAELSYDLGKAKFVHFSVFEQSKKDMEEFATHVLQAMASNTIPHNPSFSVQNVIADARERVGHVMTERLGFVKNLLETHGGHYLQNVAFGDVTRELDAAVASEKPTLLVFGRHEMLHRRPFSIGKLPFHAMLNLNCPVMVVPTVHQLR